MLAGVLAWIVVAVIGQQFAAATDGLKPFDLQPGLQAGDIPAQLPPTPRSRVRIYLRFFVLDFFLPLFAYGTLVLLWALAPGPRRPGLAGAGTAGLPCFRACPWRATGARTSPS